MAEIERRPLTFAVQELWLLHDFVRHEIPDMERWKYPPADPELNEEIALAIEACASNGMSEYTLDLTKHQLLVIDYLIRHDYKTAQMAKGRDVLLKVFKARREMAGLTVASAGDANDKTYQEVKNNAAANRNTDDYPNDYSGTRN